jgi:hypothetical protein
MKFSSAKYNSFVPICYVNGRQALVEIGMETRLEKIPGGCDNARNL